MLTIEKDSENAKAMLAEYHIGTLDDASLKILQHGGPHPVDTAPRGTFLQAKVWTKAILSAKEKVSADTKIFTFDLEHAHQTIGLPVGQHLLMRLRDPVTREAIIRSYTPISECTEEGKLRALIKIYRDAPEHKGGGKMTQALDSIPIGHWVEMKGPVGKFEYLGRGVCAVSGRRRKVRRFVMVCAGSGITPIFQVLRAVLADPDDPTFCLVLDGNRTEEDILCKRELDHMAAANPDRCRLLYTLSRPSDAWTGLRGRLSKEVFEKEVGPHDSINHEDLVLICGPEPLEKSVHSTFTGMGWKEDDLLFF